MFGFFPLFCLTFFSLLWLFFTVGLLLYFAHDHIHTHSYTDRPSFGVVSSLHPLIAIFPVILLVFCTASPVHTHFPCLSILFLSNMLLADTLFSSRLPLLAELYFLVFVWISSPISHQHMICQTIAVAFTGAYLLSSV